MRDKYQRESGLDSSSMPLDQEAKFTTRFDSGSKIHDFSAVAIHVYDEMTARTPRESVSLNSPNPKGCLSLPAVRKPKFEVCLMQYFPISGVADRVCQGVGVVEDQTGCEKYMRL